MGYNGISPIFFKSVSNVTAVADVQLGTRRVESGEEYVYCYNNTGSSVTQGALMIKSLTSLTRSSTDALDWPLVCVKHAAVPAAEYFWGLVRGEASVMSIAMTAGDLLTVGADGAVATYITATLPTGVFIGKALSTSTGNAQPNCHLRLFG
jgi:hypothetical protein